MIIIRYLVYLLGTSVVSIATFLNLAPQFGSNPTTVQKESFKILPNYKDGQFQNLQEHLATERVPSAYGKNPWKFFEFFKVDTIRRPKDEIQPTPINLLSFQQIDFNNYKIAWLGHSAFLLNLAGKTVLLDPMLGLHAAPVPLPIFKRFNSTLPFALESLKNIDFVVISHDHYDHLDYNTIKAIHDRVAIFLVPLGVGSHLQKWGVPIEKIIELNWNQNHKTDDIEFVCLPARHFSGRGILNQKTTLWSSWAIKTASSNIYFSGDSGYGKHLKQIGLDHGPFDLSLIDCGQYNQAWYNVHMFPNHVVKAANDLNSIYFMPIHWGGFTLSTHAWDEPAREIIRLSERIEAKYVIPEIGEVISKKTINTPTTRWWERY